MGEARPYRLTGRNRASRGSFETPYRSV